MNDFDIKKSAEFLTALELMALQYLQDDKGNLDHRFMSAGEWCIGCLENEGLVVGAGRKYRFTKKSEYYADE